MPSYYKPYRVVLETLPRRARVVILMPSSMPGSTQVRYNRQSLVDKDLPEQWELYAEGLASRWIARAGDVKLVKVSLNGLRQPVRHDTVLGYMPGMARITPFWDYDFDAGEVRRVAGEAQADILVAPVVHVTNQESTDVSIQYQWNRFCRGVPATSVTMWFLAFSSNGELIFASPDFPTWRYSGAILNEAVDLDGVRCRSLPRETVDFKGLFEVSQGVEGVLR